MESIFHHSPTRCHSGPDHINSQPTQPPASRGRGRPPRVQDNSRVAAFLIAAAACYPAVPASNSCRGPLCDVLTGAQWLQSEGQASTRSLSRVRLLRVLSGCPAISPQAVRQALGGVASRSTVDRYAASARVASRAILGLLERHPEWEAEALEDSAYLREVHDLGFA